MLEGVSRKWLPIVQWLCVKGIAEGIKRQLRMGGVVKVEGRRQKWPSACLSEAFGEDQPATEGDLQHDNPVVRGMMTVLM